MPLPQTLSSAAGDPCSFAERWGFSIELATLLLTLGVLISRDRRLLVLLRVVDAVKVISGFRDRETQESLGRQGRPTAPFDQSTHTSCPATGVDLSMEGLMDLRDAKAREAWATVGALAQGIGLRWGGGSPLNPSTGLPVDFNHFDMGPRVPNS